MESRNLGNKTKMIKLMSNVGNYGLIIMSCAVEMGIEDLSMVGGEIHGIYTLQILLG